MKIAIDSYCYHRFFGECYPGLEEDPGRKITVWDFLDKAQNMGVDGVSLESCFIPFEEPGLVARLREELDARKLERVWAWGHPSGLGSGTNADAALDLKRNLAIAHQLGSSVMRICAGGRRTRPATWAEHKRGLLHLLKPLLESAEQYGVVMAIENHIDLLADEMLDLMTTLDSPWLGVCFDTANNLRMFEHPVAVAQKLAPYIKATHIKDVLPQRGDPKLSNTWPSVPLGQGLVEIPEILGVLREADYTGLLAVEIDYLHPLYREGQQDEELALIRSVAYLKNAVEAV
ncbi:sugar phosphate isomerase/epimerase family protein [Polaromonas jejuensis]|uniref:Sugar phosphate isomerase/epimerase family protein n=1 Tax=Polaromonas jejuensis TaxID=457502 RepID=A0ABW0QDF8_9BURK|nr:sugar phosphate isomerase/epimerase family protein [Polaromonas jejuensis]